MRQTIDTVSKRFNNYKDRKTAQSAKSSYLTSPQKNPITKFVQIEEKDTVTPEKEKTITRPQVAKYMDEVGQTVMAEHGSKYIDIDLPQHLCVNQV